MSNKHSFSKAEFQDFTVCLSNLTQITYRQGVRILSEEQFLEGLAGKDPQLADRVREWIAAGTAMRQHIESRQDVPNNGGLTIRI